MRFWAWLTVNATVLQTLSSILAITVGIWTILVLIATKKAAESAAAAARDQAIAATAQAASADAVAALTRQQLDLARTSSEASLKIASDQLALERLAHEAVRQDAKERKLEAERISRPKFSIRYQGSLGSFDIWLDNNGASTAFDVVCYSKKSSELLAKSQCVYPNGKISFRATSVDIAVSGIIVKFTSEQGSRWEVECAVGAGPHETVLNVEANY